MARVSACTRLLVSFRLLASIAVLAAPCLHAQRYSFRFYGLDEGLNNLTIESLMQDSQGFIWAGTENGLFRFDGNQFVEFTREHGLPNAYIEAIHEGPDKRLWIGAATGLFLREGNRFRNIPIGAGRSVLGAQGIATSKDGRLFLATNAGLMIGAGGRDLTFQTVAPVGKTPSVHAVAVAESADGPIAWYACGGQLCRWSEKSGPTPIAQPAHPSTRWDALLFDRSRNLWIRGEKALAVLRPGSHALEPISDKLPLDNLRNSTLALDDDGNLILPSTAGITIGKPGAWRTLGPKQGFEPAEASVAMIDREGNFWIGTRGLGLARWLGHGEWTNFTLSEGLPNAVIWAITQDRSGQVWAGTQRGLAKGRRNGNAWTWTVQPGTENEWIDRVHHDESGNIWYYSPRDGLNRVSPAGVRTVYGLAAGVPKARATQILADDATGIWLATNRGLYHSEPGQIRFTPAAFGDLPVPQSVWAIRKDKRGNLWFGTRSGLYLLDLSASKPAWRAFTASGSPSGAGLRDNWVMNLAAAPDGALWLGYRSAFGLTKVTYAGGQAAFEHWDRSTGLPSDYSLFLGFDSAGRLWNGTDRGVDVASQSGGRLQWTHFSRADGLVWEDTDSEGFHAEPGGAVWIGTSNGLSRYDPAPAPRPAAPPRVVIVRSSLGKQLFDPTRKTTVSNNDRALSVQYSALTFVRPSQTLFRYRIVGLSNDWRETRLRELDIPELNPGSYRLEIAARTYEGVWSAEPATAEFEILPPWWATLWFRVGGTIGALGLLAFTWRKRIVRHEAIRGKLEEAVAERTSQLAEQTARAERESRHKSEFLANISHELRTPMNGVIGMSNILLDSKLDAEQHDHLSTLKFSAESLLTLLNDILDFSKVHAGHLEITPAEFNLEETVSGVVKMFALRASERNLTLDWTIAPGVRPFLLSDDTRLRQILVNLVGNALKFTLEGGVRVSVEETAESTEDRAALRFTVADTGIGIPADKLQTIFEPFQQADGSTSRRFGGTGLGLAISTQLIDLLGGKIWVESVEGNGSVFHFTLTCPVVCAPRALPAADDPVAAPLPPMDILVVEDNKVNQKVARILLERAGHRVVIAQNGREALTHAATGSFDAVLMDVQMPELDGMDATRLIRRGELATGKHLPIIAMTAHAMVGDEQRCLDAGMDAYVQKPIQPAKLFATLRATALTHRAR